MLLTYFLNVFEIVPVAPIITDITFVFTFHMRCVSIVRSLYYYYYYCHGRVPPCLPPLFFRNLSPQAFSTVGQVGCPVSVKSGAICVGQRFIRNFLRLSVRVTCGNRAGACYRHSVEHKVRQVYRPESQHRRDVPLSEQHKKQAVCDVPPSEHAAVCAVWGCKRHPESTNLINPYPTNVENRVSS